MDHLFIFIAIDWLEEYYPVGQNLAYSATSPDQPIMKDPEEIANIGKSQWFDGEVNNGAYYGWMKMINNYDVRDSSYVQLFQLMNAMHWFRFIYLVTMKWGILHSSSELKLKKSVSHKQLIHNQQHVIYQQHF